MSTPRERAKQRVREMSQPQLAVLTRLLRAAGVGSVAGLEDEQAAALTWLASWEAETVDAIIAALTSNTEPSLEEEVWADELRPKLTEDDWRHIERVLATTTRGDAELPSKAPGCTFTRREIRALIASRDRALAKRETIISAFTLKPQCQMCEAPATEVAIKTVVTPSAPEPELKAICVCDQHSRELGKALVSAAQVAKRTVTVVGPLYGSTSESDAGPRPETESIQVAGAPVAQLIAKLDRRHWCAIWDAAQAGVGYICSDFDTGELTASQCAFLQEWALRRIAKPNLRGAGVRVHRQRVLVESLPWSHWANLPMPGPRYGLVLAVGADVAELEGIQVGDSVAFPRLGGGTVVANEGSVDLLTLYRDEILCWEPGLIAEVPHDG